MMSFFDLSSQPTRRACLQAGVASMSLLATPWVHATAYTELKWESLIPPKWDGMKAFADLQSLSRLPDEDPKVKAHYEKMRKVWDEAPTVRALEGKKVKLPGFIVPLERTEQGLKEFLLVPYFGACLHSPPPPANQIVHVLASKPVNTADSRAMRSVWVTGTMSLKRTDSEMGVSGYQLAADTVVSYRQN